MNMKTNAEPITLWACQHQRVVVTLSKDGVYYVKRAYVKQKYGESAWIFEAAYGFITQLAQSTLPKPSPEAENLVWLYADKRWASDVAPGYKLLQVQVPADQAVLFDRRKWEAVLGLRYLGTPQQQQSFEQSLTRAGIKSPAELFRTSFYPLQKRELLRSWQDLADIEGLDPLLYQAGTWQLRKEWIANWDEVCGASEQNRI